MTKLTKEQKQAFLYAILLLVALFGLKWLLDHRDVLFPTPNPKSVPVADFSPETRAWADNLASKENCDPEGTWDSGSLSYGKYCYKVLSWREDASSTRFYEHAETVELDNFRGDPDEQDRVLAWVVNNKSPSHLVMRWKTTIIKKGLGLP